MQDAMTNMKQLSQNAQIVENSTKNEVDFLFDLNEHQYEFQRHILCRSCYVSEPKSTKLWWFMVKKLRLWFAGAVSIDERWFHGTFEGKTSMPHFEWIDFIFIGLFPRNRFHHFTVERTQHNNITRCKYWLILSIWNQSNHFNVNFSWTAIIWAMIRAVLMTVAFPTALQLSHN